MKTVLVTGASRGIGKAAVKLFVSKGYNVIINYHKSEAEAKKLEAMCNREFPRTLAVRADVSDPGQVAQMFEAAKAQFGRVGILVNNAGISYQALFADTTHAQWQHIFDVNVTGMFNCCKCALPDMIERKSGNIINISSMWGQTGASMEVAYSASKSAVIGFTKALAKEMGPSNIRVNCVAPGTIETDMNAGLTQDTLNMLKESTALRKIGHTEDIANAILFLASEHSGFITGQVLSPNGGSVI
ncbi:MAG: elongation factor P 5-aminopentanone reductase [Christensenellaceae bacterium]|jgi:3-oxoacyl-[acyl-carrier protein] reductase